MGWEKSCPDADSMRLSVRRRAENSEAVDWIAIPPAILVTTSACPEVLNHYSTHAELYTF